MSMVLLGIGLLLFVGLVVLHELGHFILARRNGVDVEEFGIGFPPRAKLLKKRKGTEYTLNWLPLGGFVKLKGENDASDEPGSFGAASLGAKVKIMLAGVAVNLVTAFVLLTLVAALGIPKLLDDQFTIASDTKIVRQDVLVGYVEPDSPAAKAGLQARDRLVALGPLEHSRQISRATDVSGVTRQYAGQPIAVTYRRNGQQQQATAQIRPHAEVEASKKTDNHKGYLGIVPSEYTLQRSTWSAPIVAAGLIRQFTAETFKGIGSAVAGLFRGDTAAATEQVSGPVGVFVILRDGSLLGYEFILLVIAVLSLTLALMNVLPIPALDGGRLFVTLLFRGLKKPLTKSTEDVIHGTGFAVLMLLFLLITVVDVRRFF